MKLGMVPVVIALILGIVTVGDSTSTQKLHASPSLIRSFVYRIEPLAWTKSVRNASITMTTMRDTCRVYTDLFNLEIENRIFILWKLLPLTLDTYGTVSTKAGKSLSDARVSLLCDSGKNPNTNRMAPETNDKIDKHKIRSFFNFIMRFFVWRQRPLNGLSPAHLSQNKRETSEWKCRFLLKVWVLFTIFILTFVVRATNCHNCQIRCFNKRRIQTHLLHRTIHIYQYSRYRIGHCVFAIAMQPWNWSKALICRKKTHIEIDI